MVDLPKTLNKFTAFVDGQGFAGKITEGTPPKLVLKVEEFIAGGMVTPIDLAMPEVEKMEFSFSVKETSSILHANFGKPDLAFTIRGAQGYGDQTEAVIYEMRGLLKEIDAGSWKPGGDAQSKYSFTARALKLTIGSNVVINIDAVNMILEINGKDMLSLTRSALGL